MHIGSLIFGAVRTVILDGDTLPATGIHILIDLDHLAIVLSGKKPVAPAAYVNAFMELFLTGIDRVITHTIRRSYQHKFIPLYRE